MTHVNCRKYSILFLILPLIMAAAIAVYYGCKLGQMPMPMPMWNDEAAYYELIKTWIHTGMPTGYWGFLGEHAIWGTGGAWSPAILIPYALWGMMFGWNYSSVAIANVVMLCIINAWILRLLRPEKRVILRFILLEVLSCHLWLYMNTIMSEILRYGLAMLLAAMLYRLWTMESVEKNKIFAYVIVPIFLVITIQIYIFFAFAVPLYIFAILKKQKLANKLIAAFFCMVIVAGGSYYFLHLISSNYNIYKTEMLFEALQSRDIMGTMRTFLWMCKVGILDLWNCFRSSVGHGMFHWFVAFLIGTILIAGVQFFCRKQTEKEGGWNRDRQILLLVIYSICIFVWMYITVYSLEAFTFFRGVGIVILFSLVWLLHMEHSKCFVIVMTLYAIGMLYVPSNMGDFHAERYLTNAQCQRWDQLADDLEHALIIEDTGEPWENTAVLYTMEPKLICAMPAGIGVNFAMYSEEIVEEAKYLVFSLKDREHLRGDWLEHSHEEIYEKNKELLNSNYFIQYMDREYVIYQRQCIECFQ